MKTGQKFQGGEKWARISGNRRGILETMYLLGSIFFRSTSPVEIRHSYVAVHFYKN